MVVNNLGGINSMANMDNLSYYEWAKDNVDVQLVIDHYRENHEEIKDYLDYIQKENMAKNNLIYYLTSEGFSLEEMEDIMLQCAGEIQNIYFELGLKIGSKIGAKYLLENDN